MTDEQVKKAREQDARDLDTLRRVLLRTANYYEHSAANGLKVLVRLEGRLDSLERELEAQTEALVVLNARLDECEHEQNAEVVEAARQTEEVLGRMLAEDGWPPERLAARLNRLKTILGTALAMTEGEVR